MSDDDKDQSSETAESAEAGIHMHVFGRTDVGQIREHNEDNFLVADLTRKSRSLMEGDRRQVVGRRGTVLGVCDGMGGAAAGEVASQLAVDIIYERLTEGEPPLEKDELARRLVNAVEDAGGPNLQRGAGGSDTPRNGHDGDHRRASRRDSLRSPGG